MFFLFSCHSHSFSSIYIFSFFIFQFCIFYLYPIWFWIKLGVEKGNEKTLFVIMNLGFLNFEIEVMISSLTYFLPTISQHPNAHSRFTLCHSKSCFEFIIFNSIAIYFYILIILVFLLLPLAINLILFGF